MGEEKNWWIFILMAKKLQFLPSVCPMRKRRAGKQNFTQVLPWAKYIVQPSPGIYILRDSHIVLSKGPL